MRYRRNVITWTAMVAGHAQCEDLAGGIYLCREMMLEGVRPQPVTFAGLLDGCRGREALAVGASIHGYVRLGGMESDSAVNNALVNMYSKSGGLEDAVKVFNDQRQDLKTSSWASVIGAYVQHGLKREATELYHHLDLEGMEVDENVFASVLGFCDSATQVRDVHSRILASGLEQRMVAANAVMTAYGKAGHPDEAREVFLGISRPSVISWSALIAAYGQHWEAIKTFELMNLEGVKPNATTLTSVLRACATVGAHEQGRRIHALVLAGPYAQNTTVLNAAASLYAKCSRVADASRVFSSIPCKDAVSWNAIVSAYAKQGLFRDAIFLSRQMQVEGFVPDDITFITILYSCSQSGQLAAACECLSSMVCDFGMVPAREHYVCLIDVLGRAGRVGDAVELKDCMPYEADAVALESLRAASRITQNG
ncbi:pentatricopeptide repeat-containing protein At2g34400 isoform X1 [Selaginella moellendorffii]|nr:pentatricopeptide repeat-containing protein At2g34400 isoform X1 [Selaginella moellendorffii]XP_024540889.1 pentatricopeptide repeat-containing protein At2g34400 isoform X1 [Selaginella moellendorffii]|eukprot:XP_024540887.1 pentatricopeptide repeat-containing protein At2g34400 isoform X1 [Selaginella moellendorffii]